MTTRSAEQLHVRFTSELTVPPADRQKKSHSFYPKVAQEKGRSQRQASFDLFWRWDKLSSVPHCQNERKHHEPKRLLAKTNVGERDFATVFCFSGRIAQHTRQRWIFTAFSSDGHLQATLATTAQRSQILQNAPKDDASRGGSSTTVDTSRPHVGYVDKRLMVFM